jgi:CelD/BcsL family acetyltransferase involved in cellulose biosynthesis
MNTVDAANLRVEEISTLARFQEIEGLWTDLCHRSIDSYPMLGHAWLCSWWRAFGPDIEYHVVLVWHGTTLVGAAPLAVKTEKRFLKNRRVLGLITNIWVDRMSFLLAQPSIAIVDSILEYVRSHIDFDLMDFYPLEDASPQTALLLNRLRQWKWKVGIEEYQQSPFLSLPSSWEQLLENLSPSFRQTVRRKIRKIEGMKNVTMKIVTDPSCIDAIVDVSRESWQHDVGTSMASSEQILGFYTPIIHAAARDGTLCCAVMEVDGEPAAFEFNLIHRNTLYNFKLGFKKKFSELSTGIVLKAFLLKEILDGNADIQLTEYDFMGSAEPYKLNWTKSIRYHSRYYVFAPKWDMSLAHWALFTFKPVIKRRLPWMVNVLHKIRGKASS